MIWTLTLLDPSCSVSTATHNICLIHLGLFYFQFHHLPPLTHAPSFGFTELLQVSLDVGWDCLLTPGSFVYTSPSTSISNLIQFSVKPPPVIICKLCAASLAECARFIWWCPCMEAKFQSERFNCGILIAVVLESLAGLSFQSPFCLLKRFAFDTHKWVDSPWRRRTTVGDLQQEKHWWRQDTKDSFASCISFSLTHPVKAWALFPLGSLCEHDEWKVLQRKRSIGQPVCPRIKQRGTRFKTEQRSLAFKNTNMTKASPCFTMIPFLLDENVSIVLLKSAIELWKVLDRNITQSKSKEFIFSLNESGEKNTWIEASIFLHPLRFKTIICFTTVVPLYY